MSAVIPAAAVETPSPGWMRVLQSYDQQLATIGYRLSASAGDLCADKTRLTGIVVQDLSQYDRRDRDEARRTFGFAGYPEILAVARHSPAADAGVAANDSIVAVNGSAVVPASPTDAVGSKRSDAVRDRIEAASGTITLRLIRAGTAFDASFAPQTGCASRFQTSTSDVVNAAADGDTVEVNIGAMRFAGDYRQVAAVVAHELAHNILHHRARLAAAGVKNDRSRRGARLTLQTEEEADRLSVYLLDRAGYDPHAAIDFWTRIGETGSDGEFHARAYLDPQARIALLAAEIARIAAMKAAGQAPRPDFMTGGTLPALE